MAFGPCLTARFLKIPLVIHDSDVTPGLSHAMIEQYASLKLTGLVSSGRDRRLRHVGIPVNPAFSLPMDEAAKQILLVKYGLPPKAQIILVTGGGGGARRLNLGVLKIFDDLKLKPTTYLVVAAGKQYYAEAASAAAQLRLKNRVLVFDFVDDMPDLLRASLGVVTRAGATILTEVSLAGKPTIIVPNALLPRSHQVNNARLYQKAKAAWLVSDDGSKINLRALKRALNELINNSVKRRGYQKQIKKMATTGATSKTLGAIEEVLALHSRSVSPPPTVKRQRPRKSLKKRLWLQRLSIVLGSAALCSLATFMIYRLVYVSGFELQFSQSSSLIRVEQQRSLQAEVEDFFAKQQNVFQRHFAPDITALSDLLLARDYVLEIKAHRSLSSTRLIIAITPRKILGHTVTPDGQFRLVTGDGYAIAGYSALLDTTDIGLEIESYHPASPERQLILLPLDIEFISQVNLYLASQGYKLNRVALSPNASEIIFYIKGYDFKIVALKTRDPVKQAIALTLTLDFFARPYLRDNLLGSQEIEVENVGGEEAGLEPIIPEEYVDIRLIDRVIYK